MYPDVQSKEMKTTLPLPYLICCFFLKLHVCKILQEFMTMYIKLVVCQSCYWRVIHQNDLYFQEIFQLQKTIVVVGIRAFGCSMLFFSFVGGKVEFKNYTPDRESKRGKMSQRLVQRLC